MDEAAVVRVQLGRTPRGSFAVAARCPYGLPSVIRTEPFLPAGEPFPTLYWLTCPAASRACGGLESSGRMVALNELLGADATVREAYARAHEAYVADRDSGGVIPGAPGAGGMPQRVKCLHALLAHQYATTANPIGAMVQDEIGALDAICPGACVVRDDGAYVATPGHPHMKGRR